jgi:hypothetical protein
MEERMEASDAGPIEYATLTLTLALEYTPPFPDTLVSGDPDSPHLAQEATHVAGTIALLNAIWAVTSQLETVTTPLVDYFDELARMPEPELTFRENHGLEEDYARRHARDIWWAVQRALGPWAAGRDPAAQPETGNALRLGADLLLTNAAEEQLAVGAPYLTELNYRNPLGLGLVIPWVAKKSAEAVMACVDAVEYVFNSPGRISVGWAKSKRERATYDRDTKVTKETSDLEVEARKAALNRQIWEDKLAASTAMKGLQALQNGDRPAILEGVLLLPPGTTPPPRPEDNGQGRDDSENEDRGEGRDR